MSLPISLNPGIHTSYVDALFISTSAVCVTGLTTILIFSTYNFLGQFIILILIQIGGLGVITIISIILIKMNRKIGLTRRLLIQDAFNLNTMSGLVKFINKVVYRTIFVEAIGALLYMKVLIPDFGIKGIWLSIFNSISAFCNAGIDVIANNSLCNYVTNPIINITTCALIISGGIGFIVWFDCAHTMRKFKKFRYKSLKFLSLHSKIVICTTIFLIVSGALLILMFEYDNPSTIGSYNFGQKVMISLFQSITTRTAGFATINQSNLRNSTCLICLFLMFIGGSPCGTAGGIKTSTIAILFTSTFATINNKNETIMFDRLISKQTIRKSIAVAFISFMILFTSTLLLSIFTDEKLIDIMYEAVSATATVGLSRNLTSKLNEFAKIILIVTMYLGRIGPMSIFLAFVSKKEKNNIIKYPMEDVSVG